MAVRDYMNEMGIAKRGSWSKGFEFVGTQRIDILSNFILLEKDFYEYELYKDKNDYIYRLGFRSKEVEKTQAGNEEIEAFTTIFSIKLKRKKDLDHLGYANLLEVAEVVTHYKFQDTEITINMFKYIVNVLAYTLMGDFQKYYGGRKIWDRLSKHLDTQVDIFNIRTKEVILKNVILHQGKYDEDFDKSLLAYQEDKELIQKQDLRPILTEIL